jgi:hypothetical protein
MALEPLYRELGGLAEHFKGELKATAVREEIDDDAFGEVLYRNYMLSHGWLNRIDYGPDAVVNPAQLFVNRTHEGVHAISQLNCPALRMYPCNPRTLHVLSPESFLHARELMEREAYAKEALFSALLAFMRPELKEDLALHTACDASMFDRITEAWFAEDGSLPHVLSEAADNALDNEIDHIGGVTTFRELYRENFLKEYEESMQGREIAGLLKSITFVTASDKDLARIGRTVGPSALGTQDTLFPAASRPGWSPAQRERIAALHEKYGIPPEQSLGSAGQVSFTARKLIPS